MTVLPSWARPWMTEKFTFELLHQNTEVWRLKPKRLGQKEDFDVGKKLRCG